MPTYFDFTVSLQNVLPRPWRRFLLPTNASFATLHSAIQDACGWSNSHLYEFRTAGQYGVETIAGLRVEGAIDGLDRPAPDAAKKRLTTYFGRGADSTALYLYDFGDGWVHDVQLNDEVDIAEKLTRRLLGGEYAFPPDDCGGPPGYEGIQEALRTGHDPEGVLEWARDVWDWTGAFDLEAATREFAGRRRR